MKKFWFAFLILVSTMGLSSAEERGVNIYDEHGGRKGSKHI